MSDGQAGGEEFLMENIENRLSTTDQWQQRIIDSWQPGTLILTSGSRMARQLVHRYRLQQIENNLKSWQPLEAQSLNGWLNRTWQNLWGDRSLAGSWLRLHLWHEIVRNNPLRSELPLDLALCQTLDQTFAVLIRHRLDPTETQYPSPLVSWRRHVCGEFISALRDLNRLHPAELPVKIAEALDSGRLPLPKRLILAAFEAVAPMEEKLFSVLSQKTAVAALPLPKEKPGNVHAVTLADHQQEIFYLGQKLLHSCQELRPG